MMTMPFRWGLPLAALIATGCASAGKLDIRPVKWIDEVFEIALASQPTPRLPTPPPVAEKRPRRGGRRATKLVQAH